jgi:hypothetical protein
MIYLHLLNRSTGGMGSPTGALQASGWEFGFLNETTKVPYTELG